VSDLVSRVIQRMFWRRRNIVIAVVAVVLVVVMVRVAAAIAAPARLSAPPPHRPLSRAAATASSQARRAAPSPAASASAATTSPSPPLTGSPAAVNIYQWLPFTPAGLAAAARAVTAFAHYYATYTYTESPAAYAGRMKGLVTPELAAALARGYAAPGMAQQRRQAKQSQTGRGRITELRAFGNSSITFLVTVTQNVTGRGGTTRMSTGYAVTVGRAGRSWRVTDIELASAGNP
jgi:hypothetical protein